MKKWKFIIENIKRFNANITEFADGRFLYCWGLLFWCAIRFGASFDDIFRYEFYLKNNFERNKFITYRRSKKIIEKYNAKNNIKILQDKSIFNIHFSEFIKRDWINLNSCTVGEFKEFVKKHREVVFKPSLGSKGNGMVRYRYDHKDDLEYTLKQYKNFIAEELIIQHDSLSRINSSSVNSVRVVTFLNGNDVQIIGCTLRVGSSNSFADNLSAGGVAGNIDIETGIINSSCKNTKLERFLFHPTTKTQLIGYSIPNWDKVIDTVKSAAILIPDIRYIGWDIAILNNGVDIIEANHDPAHRAIQMFDQVGKYQVIKKYLD